MIIIMEIHILTWMMDIFFICALHILYNKVFGAKFERKVFLIIGWSTYFIVWNISSFVFIEKPIITSLCSMLINFSIVNFLYIGSIRAKVIIVAVVIITGIIAETIISFTFVVLGVNFNDFVESRNSFIYIGSAASKILWLIFVKLMSYISKRDMKIKIAFAEWIEIFLVPIGSLIIFYIVAWDNYFNITLPKIIVFGVLFIINILTFFIYQKIQLNAQELIDKELIKQQNEYYKARYEDTQIQWAKLKKIRHDMKNNYVLELGYLEEERYDDLRKIYTDAIGNLSNFKNVIDSGNIGINSIINYKTEIAKELKIKISKEIQIGGEIKISNEDANILFGNLFDNAIEAVSKLSEDERIIFYKLHSDKTALFFQINNAFDGTINRDVKNKIVTSKKDRENHGIGFKTINEIVKKYEGKIVTEQRENQFEVKIFLYM